MMFAKSSKQAAYFGVSSILLCRLFSCTSKAELKLPQRPLNFVRSSTVDALRGIGHSNEDSEVIADVVMYAELRGNNQGLIKLVSGGLAFDSESKDIKCVHETPISSKIDGGQRIGMVVVSHAVTIAVEKARSNGMAIVGCSNYSSATGALGYWTRKITDAGLIGIVMSQCQELVAPYGSFEPIFGTNPISIGIPTVPRPQILDMATSASAYYGIKMAESAGVPIPNDIAYDSKGRATTDPSEALKGAIRVFDRSFKGSHLALMVELLAGALAGATMTDKEAAKNFGSLVIVIDPSILGSKEEFLQRANEMCVRVKNAKLLQGHKEIVLPGERGDQLEAINIEKGTIPVSDTIFQALQKLAKKE